MSQINLASYKNIYLQTAKEYVENITKSFEKLNKNSKDVKAIEVLHISSHSLKSQSQVMGYNDIAKLSKSLEEFSNNALQTNKSLTNDLIVDMEKSFKELKKILKRVQDDIEKN